MLYNLYYYYSDTYMGIKHENTAKVSGGCFHHRDTLALFITLTALITPQVKLHRLGNVPKKRCALHRVIAVERFNRQRIVGF